MAPKAWLLCGMYVFVLHGLHGRVPTASPLTWEMRSWRPSPESRQPWAPWCSLELSLLGLPSPAGSLFSSLLRRSLPLEASILKSSPLPMVGGQASPPTPLPHLTLFPSNSFGLIHLGRGTEHLVCYIGRYPVGSCDASLSSLQAFSCLYKWLLPLSYSKIPFHSKYFVFHFFSFIMK